MLLGSAFSAGLVLDALEERAFPVECVSALASGRGDDRSVEFGSEDIPVGKLTEESLAGLDIAHGRQEGHGTGGAGGLVASRGNAGQFRVDLGKETAE